VKSAEAKKCDLCRVHGEIERPATRNSGHVSLGPLSDVMMSRTELIIQLVKVAIGFAFGAYFLWWSLEVLNRLPPQ
jgi:hypothetical protein